MKVFIVLYDSTNNESTYNWSLVTRSLRMAVRWVAELYKRHNEAIPHTCTLDRYTISTLNPTTNLWRITTSGGIHNGQPTQPAPDDDKMAG